MEMKMKLKRVDERENRAAEGQLGGQARVQVVEVPGSSRQWGGRGGPASAVLGLAGPGSDSELFYIGG